MYAVEDTGDLFAMPTGEDARTGEPAVAWARCVVKASRAVFRADLGSSRWSEVRSVGDDTALFVGRWCTLARRVSQYELPGNRIHFLDDDDAFSHGCAHHFGSYDMRDGKTYPLLELRNGGAGDTRATWLFPR